MLENNQGVFIVSFVLTIAFIANSRYKRIVPHLTHGRAVTIVPINKEVTTQEAADILNVSRPYLVKLLEQGDIPFIKVGVHRRISLDDLMEYKERRDAERLKAIAEMAQMSQDLGLYD